MNRDRIDRKAGVEKYHKYLCLGLNVFIACLFSIHSLAQCEIIQQIVINDQNSTAINIEVDGAINNDLSTPLQGLCKVQIKFAHDAIGQLSATLTSPLGQQVQLIGPAGANNEITQGLDWDVCFVSDAQTPMPDSGQPSTWNNNIHVWPLFSPTFDGSYHPAQGNLEDFNFGPVNGTWTLEFQDAFITQDGIVEEIRLIFCDDTGVTCETCHTTGIDDVTLLITPIGCLDDMGTGSFGQVDIQSDENFISFEWIGPGGIVFDQASPVFTTPGTYFLTATNEAGCFYQDTVNILLDPALSDLVFEDIALACNETSGFFYVSGNLSEWTYEWTGPSIVDPTIANPEISIPGAYSVILKNVDDTNCFLNFNLEMMIEEGAEVELIASGNIGCEAESVTVIAETEDDLQISSWMSSEVFTIVNEFEIQVDQAGTYFFVHTDLMGCTKIDSIEIIESFDVADVEVVNDELTITCDSTSVVLEASSTLANPSFVWTDQQGNTINGNTPTVSVGGKYFVCVTSPGGCKAIDSLSVIENTEFPVVNLFPSNNLNLTCSRDSISLSATISQLSSDFIAFWIDPSGNEIFDNPNIAREEGTWQFHVIAENGCDVIDSFEIIDARTMPEITLDDIFSIACDSTSVEITVDSPDNITDYNWSGPGILSGQGTETILASEGGNYFVTITDVLGCTNVDSTMVLASNDAPEVELVFSDTLSCVVDTICVTALSNMTIIDVDWTGTSGIAPKSFDQLSVTEPGMYTARVRGENGCITVVPFEISLDAISPDISAVLDTIDCNNPIVDISVLDDLEQAFYEWTGPGILSPNVNTQSVSIPGLYEVAVTNLANGCISSLAFDVIIDDQEPIIDLMLEPLNCQGDAVQIEVQSDLSLVSFEWMGPNGEIFNVLEPFVDQLGVYTLVASGANGCSVTRTVELVEIDEPPLFGFTSGELSCAQAIVSLCATEAEDDLSVEWFNEAFESIGSTICVEVSEPGDYTLVVTGTNTCTASQVVVVNDSNSGTIDVEIIQNEDVQCDQQMVTLTADVNDDGTLIYEWIATTGEIVGSVNTPSITINGAGVYELNVSSTNSDCTGFANIVVNELPSTINGIELEISSPDCFGDTDGSIDIISVDGGIAPLLFRLDSMPFESDPVLTNLPPGAYILEVMDAQNCVLQEPVVIEFGNDPDVSLGDDISIPAGQTVDIEAIINFNLLNVADLTWQSTYEIPCIGCFEFTLNPLSPGFVEVLVTDINGCTSTDRIRINIENDEILTANIFSPNGDGMNDQFVPFSTQGIEEIRTFQIFDRWGNKVHDFSGFQPSDFAASWDGQYRGQKAENGVYTFTIEAISLTGDLILKSGSITLVN